MKIDEFYVGYQPETPKQTAAVIKKVIFAIGFSVCCISMILAGYQKKFATSAFEYGINTTLEGYIFAEPVPHLAIPLGTAVDGKEIFQHVLLVGFGKAGAKEVIENLQLNAGKPFIGSKVKLNGFMIYGDGKALMQITEEDNDKIVAGDDPRADVIPWSNIGHVEVAGEVVDPKCYFGVMKPGVGKPHRACAIRCIAGGIPPVFHGTSSEYFLLVNEKSEPVNEDILGLVGDQITLTGEGVLWNDWKILKVNTKVIQELSQYKKWKEKLIAFEKGMTQCKNEMKSAGKLN